MTLTSPKLLRVLAFPWNHRCVKLWQERQNCSWLSLTSHIHLEVALLERLIWVVVGGRTYPSSQTLFRLYMVLYLRASARAAPEGHMFS